MTEKKGLKDAYSLKTPEDSMNLYKTWASTYDNDFAKQNDYRSPIEIAKYFARWTCCMSHGLLNRWTDIFILP